MVDDGGLVLAAKQRTMRPMRDSEVTGLILYAIPSGIALWKGIAVARGTHFQISLSELLALPLVLLPTTVAALIGYGRGGVGESVLFGCVVALYTLPFSLFALSNDKKIGERALDLIFFSAIGLLVLMLWSLLVGMIIFFLFGPRDF